MKTKNDQATKAVIEQIIDAAVHYRVLPLQGSDWEPVLPVLRAAPNLLEACRYLLDLCERHTPGLPESNENEGKEWKRSMAIAHAAIAKADEN